MGGVQGPGSGWANRGWSGWGSPGVGVAGAHTESCLMQATVGAIVSGGAADVDGRLLIGDEITHINHHSVMDASHRDVISLMGQAAALGEVMLGIRRKMPLPETLSPTSGVTGGSVVGGGGFGGSLGFEHKHDFGGPVAMEGQDDGAQIPQGIRDVVVDRPNTQTSFGFVLQSNTLRAGCMICESVAPGYQTGGMCG